jgi:hypothetical protein
LLTGAFWCAGCATKAKVTTSREVGMAKEQIIALYGKSNNQRVDSEGETWTYNLSASDAIIPWTSGYRPNLRIIRFGKDSRVKSCSTNNGTATPIRETSRQSSH